MSPCLPLHRRSRPASPTAGTTRQEEEENQERCPIPVEQPGGGAPGAPPHPCGTTRKRRTRCRPVPVEQLGAALSLSSTRCLSTTAFLVSDLEVLVIKQGGRGVDGKGNAKRDDVVLCGRMKYNVFNGRCCG